MSLVQELSWMLNAPIQHQPLEPVSDRRKTYVTQAKIYQKKTNVTTDDIIPSAGRKKQLRRFKLLSVMRIGKRYRPCQFKSNKISPQRIAVHLNRLHDEGYVDRILENGLIWWERKK